MFPSPMENLSRPQLQDRQWQRLQALLQEVSEKNRYWQQRWREHGVSVSDLRSLDDIRKLPFLTKSELVADQLAHPPYGTNLTYPLSAYTRLHQTSGTTGKPMRWLDTPASWDWFGVCWEQIYQLAGVTSTDIFAFPFSFGPFIGFWAAFEGAKRNGNLTIAMGGMGSEARLAMMRDLRATVVCCTPTYALRLAEVAAQENMDLRQNDVRLMILAGEPGANIPAVRQTIEHAWGARVIDHWGMTDIGSLGVEPFAAPGGLTILETECIAEILDPEGSEPVSPGEMGELVITNLGRWGHPVIRFRTGDLVRAAVAPCPTGLPLLRLEGGILGRADDMVVIRGNNVFPSSLDAILREFPEVAEYRSCVVTRDSMPQLQIEVELVTTSTKEVDERCLEILDRVEHAIKDRLNFHPEVLLVESLPRFELKGKRFFRA